MAHSRTNFFRFLASKWAQARVRVALDFSVCAMCVLYGSISGSVPDSHSCCSTLGTASEKLIKLLINRFCVKHKYELRRFFVRLAVPRVYWPAPKNTYLWNTNARTAKKRKRIWADAVVVLVFFADFIIRDYSELFSIHFLRFGELQCWQKIKEEWTEIRKLNENNAISFRFVSLFFFPVDDLTLEPKTSNWF